MVWNWIKRNFWCVYYSDMKWQMNQSPLVRVISSVRANWLNLKHKSRISSPWESLDGCSFLGLAFPWLDWQIYFGHALKRDTKVRWEKQDRIKLKPHGKILPWHWVSCCWWRWRCWRDRGGLWSASPSSPPQPSCNLVSSTVPCATHRYTQYNPSHANYSTNVLNPSIWDGIFCQIFMGGYLANIYSTYRYFLNVFGKFKTEFWRICNQN